MADLANVLANAARGVFPSDGPVVSVVPQPSDRDAGVLALTGCAVVFADVDPLWVEVELTASASAEPGSVDLAAPLNPPFLSALCAHLDRRIESVDLLTSASSLPGSTPLPLLRSEDLEHPRIVRARRHRDEITAWTVPNGDGTVLLGRGVAGRWEVALEVEPGARGAGLGRLLARAARHLVPWGETVWAQVAPGNAASVRAFLAAGFVPVGAEALLVSPGSRP